MKRKKLNEEQIGVKIKLLREAKYLSMRDLATASGLSVSFISRVESGKTNLSVLSLQKILESLDIDMYEFFLDKLDKDPSEQIVFKKSDMAVSEDDERKWCYAYPKHPNIKMELINEEYIANLQHVEEEAHKTDIGGLIISGELTLDIKDQGTFMLKAGDAFYIKAGQIHSVRNESGKTLKIVSSRLK